MKACRCTRRVPNGVDELGSGEIPKGRVWIGVDGANENHAPVGSRRKHDFVNGDCIRVQFGGLVSCRRRIDRTRPNEESLNCQLIACRVERDLLPGLELPVTIAVSVAGGTLGAVFAPIFTKGTVYSCVNAVSSGGVSVVCALALTHASTLKNISTIALFEPVFSELHVFSLLFFFCRAASGLPWRSTCACIASS